MVSSIPLDWTCSWVWLGSDWCDPNYHPDVTADHLPGWIVRAVGLDGLVKTSEDRWRKTARTHPFELGVLASVRNLSLIGWSNCPNPAGRKSPQKTVLSPERLCSFSWLIIAVLVDRWMRRPLGYLQHGEKVQTVREDHFFAVFYQLWILQIAFRKKQVTQCRQPAFKESRQVSCSLGSVSSTPCLCCSFADTAAQPYLLWPRCSWKTHTVLKGVHVIRLLTLCSAGCVGQLRYVWILLCTMVLFDSLRPKACLR